MRGQSVSEFEYVMSVSKDLEAGKWIAVVGNEIVAKGTNAKEVFEQAKQKYPNKEPFIMKVPSDAIMLM
jgi:predicted LPLAT superfamily acyltransferase